MVRSVILAVMLCATSSSALQADDDAGLHFTYRFLTRSGYPKSYYEGIAFSPDSRELAIAIADGVNFIDLADGNIVRQYSMKPFTIAYSKDGSRLFMISSDRAELLRRSTLSKLPFENTIEDGEIGIRLESRNGKLLIADVFAGSPADEIEGISAGDELVGIGQGRTGEMIDLLGASVDRAISQLRGPAGGWLQLNVVKRGRFSSKTYTLRRQAVRIEGGRRRYLPVADADISENLAWCIRSQRHCFDSAADGKTLAMVEPTAVKNIGMYALSPDNRRFAILAQHHKIRTRSLIEVYDLETCEQIVTIPYHPKSYYSIRFGPQGDELFVGTWDSVEVFDVEQKAHVRRLSLGWNPPNARPSGSQSRGGSSTGSIALESAADAIGVDLSAPRTRSPSQLLLRMAVSSRGMVAVGDRRGNVTLRGIRTGALLKKMRSTEDEEVDELAFSPDGNWLIYLVEGILHTVNVSDVAPEPSPPTSNDATIDEPDSVATDEPTDDKPEAVAKATNFAAGQDVEVFSRGNWYPAEIVAAKSKDLWHIRYKDAPDVFWDEFASRERIRPRTKN